MVYRTYKNGYDRGVVYGVLLYTYIIRSISITNAKDLYGFIWFLIGFLTHLKVPTQIVQSPCWQVDSRQKFCFPRSKKWFSSVVTNSIWVHQLLKSQVLRACQLLIGGLWPSPARQQLRILLRASRNPNAPDLIGTLLLLWQGALLLITAYHGPNNLFFFINDLLRHCHCQSDSSIYEIKSTNAQSVQGFRYHIKEGMNKTIWNSFLSTIWTLQVPTTIRVFYDSTL